MPIKRRYLCMDKDDLAWEKNDEVSLEWEKTLMKTDMSLTIANLIKKYRPGDAELLHKPIRGGYNIFFRLEFKDGSSAAIRIPNKGDVEFPEEKLRHEVAIMRYISANTTIPVPKIYHFGTAAECPDLGPFIIMEYIEHEQTMSDALKDPALGPDDDHLLDPNIDPKKFELLYSQMANILLQLSILPFPRIGSLAEDVDGSGSFSVSERPLTQNMNMLMKFTAMPPTLLPSKECSSAEKWYSALADMHFSQLTFQRNDAVLDEDDARDRYVVRQLFRQLASKGQLSSGLDAEDLSTFRLFSEDLRPTNVLIDKDLRVVAVIDWEFAYAAPSQFSFDPPWWLLLARPEYWPDGYESFIDTYKPRLEAFLHILEGEEKKMKAGSGEAGTTSSISIDWKVPLSQRMRESWEKQTWLISYAARESWAFDFIFWRYIDEKFFGPNEDKDHHARLNVLNERELEAMEAMVELKMDQHKHKEGILETFDHDIAVAQLAKLMV